MKTNWCACLLLVTAGMIGAFTAADAGIGDWKNFTDMSNVVSLAGARNAVWIGTSGGILRYNPADSSFQKFTNSEGLTGNDVAAIGLDARGSVWVGELSGEVDVYSPSANTWENISDIALSVQTQRMINTFCASGDTMYVGTAFGVSVFSLSKNQFDDTYGGFGSFTHPNVTCIALLSGRIFVGTTSGLAVSKLGALNLAAPESWDSVRDGRAGQFHRGLLWDSVRRDRLGNLRVSEWFVAEYSRRAEARRCAREYEFGAVQLRVPTASLR